MSKNAKYSGCHAPLVCRPLRGRLAVECKAAYCMLLAVVLSSLSPPVLAVTVHISAAQLEYDGMVFEQLRVDWRDQAAEVRVDRLRIPQQPQLEVEEMTLHCDHPLASDGQWCRAGKWSLQVSEASGTWELPLQGATGAIAAPADSWNLQSSLSGGPLSASINLAHAATATRVEIDWQPQDLLSLAQWPGLPEQLQWLRQGQSAGRISAVLAQGKPPAVEFRSRLSAVNFDSPEGRYAGEGLELVLQGKATLAEPLRASINTKLSAGALLIGDFFTEFSGDGLSLDARLVQSADHVRLENIRLSDGSSLEFSAAADFELTDPLASLHYRVDHLQLEFPLAYTRYLEAMGAASTLDGLQVTGQVVWSGEGHSGAPTLGSLDVHDLSVVDSRRQRFALTGLEAHVRPGDSGYDSRLSWQGLLFQRINLGAGEVALAASPRHFALASPLHLDVLGGRFSIDALDVRLPGPQSPSGDPQIRLNASLNQLDMTQLTEALDWPSFGGTISGTIPGVSLEDGVLSVNGQIEFNVFDGQLLLSDLRVERPFGVLPSLAANIEASHIDLAQLTRVFSFGQISGRLDGYVRDLRMLDWKPVAFDAWFGTPASQGKSEEISRQAVNHLATLGGGGATAALTGPVLRLFNNFSYKRLGMGCVLHNNVCQVRGLDDDQTSVLIMDGAGVPKISIRAFNRQMDFQQLVADLAAASDGDSIRIGDKG